MKYVIFASMSCVLVGCGAESPTVGAMPSKISAPLPAGAYTLRIDVDEKCVLPPEAMVRTYDVWVSAYDPRYDFLSVRAIDNPSLVGDLWFVHGVLFRWNLNEESGPSDCGSPETIGSTAFCIYGEGPWSAAPDGTISGVLNGGVDFGQQQCLNQSHQFVLRPKG
jgi:hypothetical protein